MVLPGVFVIKTDMCSFGLRLWDKTNQSWSQLVRKSSVLVTNVKEIAEAVDRRCTRDHEHMNQWGHRTQQTARYCPGFLGAVLGALKESLHRSGTMIGSIVNQHYYLLEEHQRTSEDRLMSANAGVALASAAERFMVFLEAGEREFDAYELGMPFGVKAENR